VIKEFFNYRRPVVSFEIFPPKTEDRMEIVSRLASQFKELNPSFISVTYGAGGTTRDTTIEVATYLSRLGFEVMAHLTGVGHTAGEIDDILSRLKAGGVDDILALRGDPPKGVENFDYAAGDFKFAVDLVRHIRRRGGFGVAAAAYPEGHIASPRIKLDWMHLKEKVDAGVDFLITQLYFDNRVFYNFLDSVRRLGIACPISAGILPVLSADALKRMVTLCGAAIPAKLWDIIDKYADDHESLEKAGIEYATAQVHDLVEYGVDGVHLYTLNRAEWVAAVLKDTGLDRYEHLPEAWEWQQVQYGELPPGGRNPAVWQVVERRDL
jgi:methylenetetrahydrofolate reductase (NADPH)